MKQIEQNIIQAEPLLKRYEMLVKKWQKALNLVSSKSLSDTWTRHILDSAQLYPYIPENARVLVDMGSGAGFPALVLAVLNKVYHGPLTDIYLIESDSKKCVFLTEAARELDVHVHILNNRLETTEKIQADIITARALANVDKLLKYGQRFSHQHTLFLFLKGENVTEELKNIPFSVEKIPSRTDKKGCILRITEAQKND